MFTIAEVSKTVLELRGEITLPTFKGRKSKLQRAVEDALWELDADDDDAAWDTIDQMVNDIATLTNRVFMQMADHEATDLRERAADIEQAAKLETPPAK